MARTIQKQLITAQDIKHGVGKVSQQRGQTILELDKVDIPLGLATDAEVAAVNPSDYPRVRVGSKEYQAVNGAHQAALDVKPVIYATGAVLTENNPYVYYNRVIYVRTADLPYTLTTPETDGLTTLPVANGWSFFLGASDTSWQVIGTFGSGAVLETSNQLLKWATEDGGDGREYRWAGALPKTVPAASTPAGTGGISDSAWVYTANVAIEQALADGSADIAGTEAGKIAKRAGFFEIKADLGGVGDGVADDSAALASAVEKFALINGTYRVMTNTTIVADVFFLGDAVISVDAGVTLSIGGNIVSPDSQIFTGAGNFAITKTCKLPEIKAAWFGIVFDDQTGTIPDDNCKAIRKAAAMAGSLGIPDGLYRNRVCRIPIGKIYLDDDDNDGVYIEVPSYVAFWGYGDNSVLRPKDGAKAGDVLAVLQNGANSWSIDYLEIYGEWQLQTNAQNGIAIRPPSSPAIYSEIGRNVYIKEMRGRGISVTAGGLNDSTIAAKLVRDNFGHNLYVSKCANLNVINGKYRTAKSGSHGAVFDGASCVSARIIGNEFNENAGGGLFISNIGDRFEIKANRMQQNGTYGMYLDRVDQSQIVGNYTEQNTLSGMLMDQCHFNQVLSNWFRSNGQFGALIAGSGDNQIQSNYAIGNGSEADNTYDGINVQSNSDNNFISNNMSRMLSGTNRQRYGLNIATSDCTNNVVIDNDLKLSGVTGGFNDAGTGTAVTNGNKV